MRNIKIIFTILFLLPTLSKGDPPGISIKKAEKGILKVQGDPRYSRQTFDIKRGVVRKDSLADSVEITTPQINDLEIYVLSIKNKGLGKSIDETNISGLKKSKEKGEEGLIPDIKLPIAGSELKVGGSEKITFGGRRDFTVGQLQTETYRPSSFPDLQMKQELQVNLEGIVAQKVHVFVDQNSKRESNLKNTIRINYKGDDDEIVKSIEAGNTDISLPGTRFVGFSGTHKGLFGIKAQAELAGLSFTAIASKEEGKSEKTTYTGRAKIDTVTIYDYEFAYSRVFHLGLGPKDTLRSLRVYVSERDRNKIAAKGGVKGDGVIIDLFNNHIPGVPGDSVREYWIPQIEDVNQDYVTLNKQNGIFAMNYTVPDGYAVGVIYTYWSDSAKAELMVGDTTYNPPYDTLITLKLLKPINYDSTSLTVPFMLKNFYSLKGRDLGDTIRVEIYRTYQAPINQPIPAHSNGERYAYLLGLDLNKDEILDFNNRRLDIGLFWFPELFPFNSSGVDTPNPEIYKINVQHLDNRFTKYKIRLIYSKKLTQFMLDNQNIIEGSETVTLNGRRLSRGTDYEIDYESGLIQFKSVVLEEVNRITSNISVDYDFAPIFGLATKSIAGMRAVYKFGEENEIGTTWISRSERTPELRPRIGEEPFRNTLGEFDLTLKARPSIMTKLADMLPFVETEAQSNFTFSGEIARSFPNPNTKNEIFLDDMEGNKISEGLGVQRDLWSFASVPQGQDTSRFDNMRWYTPQAGVKRKEINPNISGLRGEEAVTILKLQFSPDSLRGSSSWSGIMRAILKTGVDFSQSKLLSIWLRSSGNISNPSWKPKLYIDLGTQMNEDAPWRDRTGKIYSDPVRNRGYGYYDSEDPDNSGYSINKDVGLDGAGGDDNSWTEGSQDSGNDDFGYNLSAPDDYSKINGTEKNQKIDTEDLNGDGDAKPPPTVDYYQFKFDLTKDDQSLNPRKPGEWQHFFINLNETDTSKLRKIGSPDWKRIVYARLWVTGFPQKDSIMISEMEVIGNRWHDEGISTKDSLLPVSNNEKFTVDVKNNQDDPDYAADPPPFDPGRDEQNRPRREQSLVLKFDSLGVNHRAQAKQTLSEAQNYTYYKTISFYVHPAKSSPSTFYFRMSGIDTTNYYEYRIELPPNSGWQNINLDLERLTHLKTGVPQESLGTWKGSVSDGPYRMVYNRVGPSITSIQRWVVGVENNSSSPISGEIWFDELRLTSVRKDKGTAARANVDMQFADVIGIKGDYLYQDSYFHDIKQKQGQGKTSSSFGISSSLHLNKFLPAAWGVAIPVSAHHTEVIDLPRFSAGNDVILNRQESRAKRSLFISRNADISYSKSTKGGKWWTRWTLDRMTARASMNRKMSDDEIKADSTYGRSLSFGYNLTPDKKSLTLFKKIKFYYLPSSFNISTDYNRNEQRSFTKLYGKVISQTSYVTKTSSGGLSIGFQPFSIIDYSMNFTRDLTRRNEGGYWDRRLGIGIESGRSQRFVFKHSPSISQWFSPNYSYTTDYREDHSTQIRIPPDSFDVRNVSNSNNATVGVSLSLSKIVGVLTHLRDEKKDSTAYPGSPRWVIIQIEKMSEKIQMFQATFSQDRTSQFSGLDKRPSLEYMFGLREGVGNIPRHKTSFLDQFTKTNTYSLSSGITMNYIDLRVTYNKRDNKTDAANVTNFTKSKKWPDLELSLSSLERLGSLKRLTSSVSTRSSYSSSKDENGNTSQGTREIRTEKDLSPLISVQVVWKKGISTTLSSNRRTNITHGFYGAKTKTVNKLKDYSLNLGYSFSAPGGFYIFPGKKIKFKSDLALTTAITYSVQTDSTYQPDNPNYIPRENINTQTISFKPTASYNFSSSVSGGLDAEYTNENNKKSGLTRRIIGLNLWAQFKF